MARQSIEDIRSEFADSKFVFVHQDDNWADEMDVNGYAVFTKLEFDQFLTQLENTRFPVTRWFGTNEEGEYDSLSDYLSRLDFKDIKQGEYKAFITMFETTETPDFWIPEPSEDDDTDFFDDEDEEYIDPYHGY